MTAPRPRIVFLSTKFGLSAVERAAGVGEVAIADPADHGSALRHICHADALLVRTEARVDEALLDHAANLRVIGRGGVGLDNIDLAACRRRGIVVVHTPAAATDAVADLAVGLMIAVNRHLVEADRAARTGGYHEARKRLRGREMKNLTLGIVGMGRIGQAVARRCQPGFGMRVIYHDIVPKPELAVDATEVGVEKIWTQADIITLHVPLTPVTRGMIDRAALDAMKPGAILINTARGACVDTNALIESLRRRRIGGAGLDVIDPEPLPPDHPALDCPGLLLSPHLGASTDAAQARMDDVVEDVIRVLQGVAPVYPAEPDDAVS